MPRIKPVKDEIPFQYFFELGPDKHVHVTRMKTTDQQELALAHPHHLGYYSLRFVHRGTGTIYIDHVPEKITDDWMMLATPDQVSWVDIPKGTHLEVSAIVFNEFLVDEMGLPADIQALVMGELSHIHRTLEPDEKAVLEQYFSLIMMEYERNAPHMQLMLAGLIRSLLLHFIRLRPQEKGKRMYWNLYREFLGLLKEHYQRHHYVSDYSEMMGITEKKLTRACKAVTDLSASAIIQQHIGFEAKRLLYYSTNTVKEISYHLGFNDPAHFNKFFRKLYDMTPGEYRKVL